jgi:carboxyl-terminal processing protease
MLIEQNYLDVSYLVIAFSKLKGEQGSVVELTIYRKSAEKNQNQNKKRGYSIKSVDVAVLLNDSTGYIKINRFAETTFEEFKMGLLN